METGIFYILHFILQAETLIVPEEEGGFDVYVHSLVDPWSENEPLSDTHHEHFYAKMGAMVPYSPTT